MTVGATDPTALTQASTTCRATVGSHSLRAQRRSFKKLEGELPLAAPRDSQRQDATRHHHSLGPQRKNRQKLHDDHPLNTRNSGTGMLETVVPSR
jgi:hypothetical protein